MRLSVTMISGGMLIISKVIFSGIWVPQFSRLIPTVNSLLIPTELGLMSSTTAIKHSSPEPASAIVLPRRINKKNDTIKNVDLAFEFSGPSSAYQNIITCFEAEIPVVSGTTGWLEQMDDISERCKKGSTFFYASNFSIGMNLFFKLNKQQRAY